jgi:hypothetical protein
MLITQDDKPPQGPIAASPPSIESAPAAAPTKSPRKEPQKMATKKKAKKSRKAKKSPSKAKVAKKAPAKKTRAPSAKKTTSRAGSPKASADGRKAEFVRNQPAAMSAKDIIAAAKKMGLSLSESYVYKLRRPSGGSGQKRGRAGGKTALVLALPADMPASDVVAHLKSKGHVISEGYVHEIRSRARKHGRLGATASARRGSPRTKATPIPVVTGTSVEKAYREVALKVIVASGLPRAKAILEEIATKLTTMSV